MDVPVQQPAAVTTPPVTSEQAAAGFAGKVIKVVDGDTIDVLTDDMETIRIRFSGVDTPERGQPYGNTSTRLQCSQSMSVSVTNGCSGARC